VKLHAAGMSSWRTSQGNTIKAEIFNTKSIIDVKSKDILEEAFPNGKPPVFGIIGGPPCQDFSMNGSRKGFNGERGQLTILYLNRILELKPTFFVMENVTGLIKNKSNREYLGKLISTVEKDYYVDSKILNALDFGVPQHRERIFFIGFRRSKFKLKNALLNTAWFPFPKNETYHNAEKKYKWPQSIVFGSKISKPQELPIELCVSNCLVSLKEENIIPNANEYFNLYSSNKELQNIKEGETNRPSFKRLHRFKYSPTACYGNNEVHLHPFKQRRLSVREALRIQGVPDSYVLPSELPLSKKFKMIGNGVPVPLAKAVATSVMHFLYSHLEK
jgi:DNA (cytosine-5)-methyltransferase 1